MNRTILLIITFGIFACGETKTKPRAKTSDTTSRGSSSALAFDTKELGSSTPAFEPHCDSTIAPKPEHDDSPMCFVPAGEFTMGTPVESDRPEDGPARRIKFSKPFYIDQFEVTNAQFARFLRAKPPQCDKSNSYCVPSMGPDIELNGTAFPVRAMKERIPAQVTFVGAQAYCAWAGKRLPTEAEWEFAARHDPKTASDRTYPWGDEYIDGVTNHFGALEPKRGRRAEVGTFKNDRSAIGAYDMGGNEPEWVSDCHSLDYACAEPCPPTARTTRCETICTEGAIVRCETARLLKGGSTAHDVPELKSKRRVITFATTADGIRCVFPQ